jgi:hypothetical protein
MNIQLASVSPKTMSVPEAGRRYFDLGRGASYAAAARGDIPTIRIGGKLRVPIIAIERKLELVGRPSYRLRHRRGRLIGSKREITNRRSGRETA